MLAQLQGAAAGSHEFLLNPARFQKFVGTVLRAREWKSAVAAARQTATALVLSLLLEKGVTRGGQHGRA